MSNVELSIDELHLDLDNPRFDGLKSEREALEKIVKSQGTKLVNLAEDIVNKGMSPAHRTLVIKAKGRSAGYIVVDGNRRLAALRVLANPVVLDGMQGLGTATSRRLRDLARDFRRDFVEPIDAYVCKDRGDARHWIEAIHTGENEGRGVVAWDGIATARYRGKNFSLKVLDFVRSAGKLSAADVAALERFPITNLDRLLETPEVRERLGLSIDVGDLQSDLPPSELLRPLKRIVSDLATKSVKVGHIKTKLDRINYVNRLGTDLPDLAKRTGSIQSLDQMTSSAQAKAKGSSVAVAKAKSLIDRKTLIPSQAQCPLNITDQKLQQVCRELRKLPLDVYPISIAASFRIFLELSLDHFGTENKLADYSSRESLKRKLELVAAALQANGVTKRDLQGFRALANNANAALNIDRLHGVIHSRYALPTATELRSGWGEVQFAFQQMWS